jgi:hypothetical protein
MSEFYLPEFNRLGELFRKKYDKWNKKLGMKSFAFGRSASGC